MVLPILQILKMLSTSKAVAETVNTLLKQFKKHQAAVSIQNNESVDIRKALEIQAALNEKLEYQVTVLQESLSRMHRSVKSIIILLMMTMFIALAALFIAIFI